MAIKRMQAQRMTLPTIEPAYEVRARRLTGNELQVEIWQLPSPASPHVHVPQRIAGLAGRNLEINQALTLRWDCARADV